MMEIFNSSDNNEVEEEKELKVNNNNNNEEVNTRMCRDPSLILPNQMYFKPALVIEFID
jgi:hypothetical protein